MTPLQQYAADHQFLTAEAAKAADIPDPIAVDFDSYAVPILKKAVRGPVLPLAGALVRDWDRGWPQYWPGVVFGARVYTFHGIRFARVYAHADDTLPACGHQFFVLPRSQYQRFYRLAVLAERDANPPGPPPVLPTDLLDAIRRNTLTFLDPDHLTRIRELGGRPKRGLLFSGPPGNGKTSACRWILQHATAAGCEVKQVTPDDYRAARISCNPAAAVKELFRVTSRGVVFFDDMDLALHDRTGVERPEDQAVFLSALDGIEPNEGVVYVFTTNCPLSNIDPAFRRPGRIDVLLHFPPPDAALRRQLMARWHADVRAAIDPDRAIADTDGMSYADVEEVKNLLVMRQAETGGWEWGWALRQFRENRAGRPSEPAVGFRPSANGTHATAAC